MSTHIVGVSIINPNTHKVVSRKADDPKLYYLTATTFAFKPEMQYCLANNVPFNIYTILPHACNVDEQSARAERDHVDLVLKTRGSQEFNNSGEDYTV